MKIFMLTILMISAMVTQCQAGAADLTPEPVGFAGWNYGTSPTDWNAISIPGPVEPADVNSIECNKTAIPEPATMALLGLGFLMALPLKRK